MVQYHCKYPKLISVSTIIGVITLVIGVLALGNYISNLSGRIAITALCFSISGVSLAIVSWKWYLYKRQGLQIKQYEVRTVNGIEQVAV